MRVLIVESSPELGRIWERHLRRLGMVVLRCGGQSEAFAKIAVDAPDVIILDLVLSDGSALAVSDYASYRLPDAQIIFVTNTSFFSDGSIFALAANACAFVQSETPPEDLAAMVEHFGSSERRGPLCV
ncbi:response regulator [Sulfitobacter sp. D35]|uniref:response regulator transcription factor n=1 Tax=Sulfitobacter sp. D35 TaxID=3083252 RepID=UPI00296F2FDD|nr:response regulator [Sulfitobacter sp. D35]MDW4497318.1 response regulator [Sulfitobacter sp. D35]